MKTEYCIKLDEVILDNSIDSIAYYLYNNYRDISIDLMYKIQHIDMDYHISTEDKQTRLTDIYGNVI